MQADKKADVIFHLLHGTFASKAKWIEESSPFTQELKSRIDGTCKFSPLRWSGRNSFAARLQAKDKIARELQAYDASSEKRIVCAHSHGGSVLSYALRDHDALHAKVHGFVFLSTPFCLYRILPSWRFILNVALSPISLLALYILIYGVSVPLYFAAFAVVERFGSANTAMAVAVSLATFVQIVISILVLSRINRWKRRWMRKFHQKAAFVSRSLTCTLRPGTNAIFIRSSGDEAAAALAVTQGVQWLVLILNSVLASIFSRVSYVLEFRRIRNWPAMLLGSAAVAVANGVAVAGVTSYVVPDPSYFVFVERIVANADDLFSRAWNEAILLKYSFAFMLGAGVLLMLAVATVIAFLILTVVLLVFNWLLTLPFGRLPFLIGGVTQVAVETTPPGEWSVVHATWEGEKPRGLFWRHSNPYLNKSVFAVIARWTKKTVLT